MEAMLLRFIVPGLCVFLASGCAASPVDEAAATRATFDRGVAAYDAKNYPEAFRIFASIDDRDLAAMRNEALMLRRGEGVAKDPAAAEALYERAARGGLATAAADLGEMLLKGEAGPADPKAALPWLAAAAAAHHPIAAFELAQMYEAGNGIDKSLPAARDLYRQAASEGLEEAAKRLAAMPATPTP